MRTYRFPVDTDVFKTSSGRLKKVKTSYDQTRLPHDVWQKTYDLRRLEDVGLTSSWRLQFTMPWRRLICNVLKTSDSPRLGDVGLRLLEDVLLTTSWRRLIYNAWKTCNLRHLEDVWFAMSWGRLFYDVLKTSVERRLCCNVVATSTQRRKKWFFLILSCLKYSGNVKCFGWSFYLGIKFFKLLRFFNHTCEQIL